MRRRVKVQPGQRKIRTVEISPPRGEMFIARRHAIRLALRRSATPDALLAGRKEISLLTERRAFEGVFAAISMSLLRSEKQSRVAPET
jgi:hypothetical protein